MTDEARFALDVFATICVGLLNFGLWDEATRARPYMPTHRFVLGVALGVFDIFLLGGIWL